MTEVHATAKHTGHVLFVHWDLFGWSIFGVDAASGINAYLTAPVCYEIAPHALTEAHDDNVFVLGCILHAKDVCI